MMFLYIIFAPIIYSFIKLVIYIIVKKYGKLTYHNFNVAGFKYNDDLDIFYSTKNAWQKNFGYSHLYDEMAPICRMIIDTEPIKFYYNNKNWLLTFWKGQYGITTGAEIGIYNTKEQYVNKKTLYIPVSDDELLDMSFKLYRKNTLITEVSAYHWWLAAFKLGMWSKPKDLKMEITINFPNIDMLNAFLSSFKKLKHSKKSYQVDGTKFSFVYKRPHTRKVWTRFILFDAIRQHYNKKNVKLYNKYLVDAIDNQSTNSKKVIINDLIPDFIKNKETITDENEKKKSSNITILRNDIYSNVGSYEETR